MDEKENYDDEKISRLEEELLGEKKENRVNIDAVLEILKGKKRFVAAGVFLILLFFALPGVSHKPEETERKAVLEGFDYFAAVQEKEGESGKDTLTAEEVAEPEEEQAGQQEESAVSAVYYPTQSIMSAFPEDSLVQIGSKVYKLPVSVSDLEADGIHVDQVGAKIPKEDVILDQKDRSGIISIDGNRYNVDFMNTQPCSYHDLYVAGITDEGKSDALLYGFAGIHVGSSEALLPDTWTDFEINDLSALNYYCYGEKEEFGKAGVYAYIKTRGGVVVSLYIRDDRLE